MAVQRSCFECIGMQTGDISVRLSLFRPGGLIKLPGGADCRFTTEGWLPVRIQNSEIYRVPVSTVRKMLAVEEVVLSLCEQDPVPGFSCNTGRPDFHIDKLNDYNRKVLLEALEPKLATFKAQIRSFVRSRVMKVFWAINYRGNSYNYRSPKELYANIKYRVNFGLFKELLKMAGHPVAEDWS